MGGTGLGTLLKNLWHFTRMLIEHGNSIPMPSYVYIAFTHQSITRRILEKDDIAARVISCCVGALVVTKLVADINARTLPVNDEELACLSAILSADCQDLTHLLRFPGALQFANMVFFMSDDIVDCSWSPTSDVLDMVQETFSILSQALPAQLDGEMKLNLTDAFMDVSQGRFKFVPWSCLYNLNIHRYIRDLVSFPCNSQQSGRNVDEESVAFHKNVH